MGLITKTVKITITNNRNLGHYREFVNENIKIGDEIEIDIIKLPLTSKQKVDVCCDICNINYNIEYYSYLRNITNFGYYTCKKCCINKISKTLQENYGVNYPLQSKIIKDKFMDTITGKNEFLNKYKNLKIIEKEDELYYQKLNLIIELKTNEKEKYFRDKKYNYISINKDYTIFDKLIKHELYSEKHCWQYDLRLKTYDTDIEFLKSKDIKIEDILLKDFELKYVENDIEISNFIKKYEWLGKMPNRPTHRFIATYKGILGGVIIMSVPNTYSKYVGENTKDIEKLISRGACASWTPKNLASMLLMFSIKWMVKNTDFRLFEAYSDTEAKEIGTIYQACNFFYLGQIFGSKKLYFDLNNPDFGWFNQRMYGKLSYFKKIAKLNNILWEDNWNKKTTLLWDNIPIEYIKLFKETSIIEKNKCLVKDINRKHKYIYILGKDNKETKKLRKLFLDNNKIYDYPKR